MSRGRKKIGSERIVSLTLPENMWAYLEDLREQHGKSMSAVLRDIITRDVVFRQLLPAESETNA